MPPFRIELKIFALVVTSRTGYVPVVQVRPIKVNLKCLEQVQYSRVTTAP
jgi:hypothetical protein